MSAIPAKLLPEEDARDSRVRGAFSPRSLRHYQTLGCIDAPEREGHRASYRFRHLVQALLGCKLLWERVPSVLIAVLIAGRDTEETRAMLLEGVEMVARAEESQGGATLGAAETWRRVRVAPGIELHLRDDLPRLKASELKSVLARMETALRRHSR